MSSYTSASFGWVKMRNEEKYEIVGMRDIQLETNIGCNLLLKDVRHVLELSFNFISKLDDEGYHNHLYLVSTLFLNLMQEGHRCKWRISEA